MMDRLTKWEHGFACLKTTELHDPCELCFESTQKLAHYEHLEEAGRLMELPCKVDEFVWVAKKGEKTRRVLLDSASDILWEIEHGYAIGYTSEEAESALKERETE